MGLELTDSDKPEDPKPDKPEENKPKIDKALALGEELRRASWPLAFVDSVVICAVSFLIYTGKVTTSEGLLMLTTLFALKAPSKDQSAVATLLSWLPSAKK
jgi:hypothetical protein